MTQVQEAVRQEVQPDRRSGGCEEVTCSFCGGKGKDPFGIMSWLSACVVCGGRGQVAVPASRRPCAHCAGTGAIKTFTCTVCRGTGFVPELPGPVQLCPECRGSGSDISSALSCQACRGRGVVPRTDRSQGH